LDDNSFCRLSAEPEGIPALRPKLGRDTAPLAASASPTIRHKTSTSRSDKYIIDCLQFPTFFAVSYLLHVGKTLDCQTLFGSNPGGHRKPPGI
jgi:hypothetical protein